MAKYNIGLNGVGITIVVTLALLLSTAVNAENATTKLSDHQRILRLERLLSPANQRRQADSVDSLRDEIASLRGQVERQSNELDNIKQRQRSFYQDMDRRINNIELQNSSGTEAASPVPPPTTLTSAKGLSINNSGVEDKAAYAVAFGLLKEGKYQQAITQFENFTKNYPQSKYADNAQYWLGEADYVSRNYKKSLADFEQLIAQFPNSSKIPGAKLKIGYVYFELKNWSAAREALQTAIKLYPNTIVSKKANERLQRMKRGGH